MRRFALAWIFFVGAATAAPISAVEAERIAVPFTCENQGGRVTVQPSAVNSYRILGEREQRPLTVCSSADARDCRVLMVHSFAISCGGVRTPWVEVAAAASTLGATRAWFEGGSLNLVLKSRQAPAVTTAEASDCLDAPARLMGPSATVGLGGFKCPLRRSESTPLHLVLPVGFAPLGEIGGRLVIEPERASPPALEANAITVAAAASQPRVQLATMRAESNVTTEPSPDAPAVLAAGPAVQGWVTTVEWQAEKRAGKHRRGWHKIALGVLVIVLLVAGLWVVAVLRPGLASAASRRLGLEAWSAVAVRIMERLGYSPAQEPRLANAALSVISLLTQTERVVQALPAVPLRDVLELEIETVRQRFAALRVSTPDPDGQDARAAGRYRLILREMERIQRIAESAAVSQSARRNSSNMRLPRTKTEAYQLLGVNPDVSESIAKKLVDALRMSWHPDHAKDDADRCRREDRIKEINIAWELINGKRTAT